MELDEVRKLFHDLKKKKKMNEKLNGNNRKNSRQSTYRGNFFNYVWHG